jgi:hypothetical protein
VKPKPSLWALFAAFLVAGCSSPEVREVEPVTGVPQVHLGQVTVNEVKEVVREFFAGRGYTEGTSRHQHEMVYDKGENPGKSSKALRVRLKLVEKPDGTWDLFGQPLAVESWRGELEAERMVPRGAGQIQAFLTDIKMLLEMRRASGPVVQ